MRDRSDVPGAADARSKPVRDFALACDTPIVGSAIAIASAIPHLRAATNASYLVFADNPGGRRYYTPTAAGAVWRGRFAERAGRCASSDSPASGPDPPRALAPTLRRRL